VQVQVQMLVGWLTIRSANGVKVRVFKRKPA
jgi:hypothetical protein